jgi:predicted ATPase
MAGRFPFRTVITGGPGSGKSTLLSAAEAVGIATSPEIAREILREPGGMELRASGPRKFAEAMLERELTAFHESASLGGPVLFDRGFPDIAGFHELSGLDVPQELDRICRTFRYEGPIFRAPPWRTIYAPDPERIQNWEEALASDAAVSTAWRNYGYELIDLPLAPVEERLEFIRRLLGKGAGSP